MELRDVYSELQGDYENMLRRVKRENIIRMFLMDFLEDEEFAKLEAAINANNDEAAFAAVHALKGVTLNMEFGFLSRSASALTENLRRGRDQYTDELFLQVKDDYERTRNIIRKALN